MCHPSQYPRPKYLHPYFHPHPSLRLVKTATIQYPVACWVRQKQNSLPFFLPPATVLSVPRSGSDVAFPVNVAVPQQWLLVFVSQPTVNIIQDWEKLSRRVSISSELLELLS